uniref:Sushi domain-containing protein n=1 Tax=Pundamilia nyererei TaxID=303518 RepID=A0A3B4H5Z4_9CICH
MEGTPYKTCENGKWTGQMRCLSKEDMNKHNIQFRYVSDDKLYSEHNDVIEFICSRGRRVGSLEMRQTCIEGCSELPNVPHAHVSEGTSKVVYQEGDVIHFSCESGYISDQISKFICTADGWLVVHQGKCYSCSTLPDVPHAQVTQETRTSQYQAGHMIHFACEPGYTSALTIKYVCTTEGWQPLQRGSCYREFKNCYDGLYFYIYFSSLLHKLTYILHILLFSDRSCKIGVMDPHLYVAGLPPSNEIMATGHKLRFLCSNTGVLIGSTEIECLENEQWNSPFPTCSGAQGCGRPPPLSDGDTKTSTKRLYQHNEKVEYICQRYHVMKGGPFKTCNDGEWTGEIRCLQPCTVNRDDMNRHNIWFRYSRDDKLYSEHDDEIEFMCTRGRPVGTLGMRQKCEHGVVHLPTCQ